MRPFAQSILLPVLGCAWSVGAFEKIALVDSYDFGQIFDTETKTGTIRIVDHVLQAGADPVRSCARAGASIVRDR